MLFRVIYELFSARLGKYPCINVAAGEGPETFWIAFTARNSRPETSGLAIKWKRVLLPLLVQRLFKLTPNRIWAVVN